MTNLILALDNATPPPLSLCLSYADEILTDRGRRSDFISQIEMVDVTNQGAS